MNALAHGGLRQFPQWLWIEHPTFQLRGFVFTIELLSSSIFTYCRMILEAVLMNVFQSLKEDIEHVFTDDVNTLHNENYKWMKVKSTVLPKQISRSCPSVAAITQSLGFWFIGVMCCSSINLLSNMAQRHHILFTFSFWWSSTLILKWLFARYLVI